MASESVPDQSIFILELDSLRELATDPGCRIQNLTDAVSLRVSRQQVSVVQQSRHLGNSKGPDGFDPNGHVQHLRGDEMAVARALQSGQLHQDADVPVRQTPQFRTQRGRSRRWKGRNPADHSKLVMY